MCDQHPGDGAFHCLFVVLGETPAATLCGGKNLRRDWAMQAPKDGDKQPLNGPKKFIITFPTDALPPVGGFWSVSMSDSRDFFVENPLNRNAIGNRAGLMEAEPEHRAGTDAARLMRRLMALTHSA